MSTAAEIKKYIKHLKDHNWNYPFEDDHETYLAGKAEWAIIDQERQRLDKDHFLFNTYCPPECRIKVK